MPVTWRVIAACVIAGASPLRARWRKGQTVLHTVNPFISSAPT
jgi:hypothetical protein